MKIVTLTSVFLLLTLCALTSSTDTTQPQPICKNQYKADLCILIDGSNSINSIGWGRLIFFLIQMVKNLLIGPDFIRVAVGQFSTTYESLCNLTTYNNSDDLIKLINGTKQQRGVTNTHLAFEAIVDGGILTDPALGHRIDAPQVCLTVTDGNSDYPDKALEGAKRMRDSGTLVIIVLVGMANIREGIAWAGDPSRVYNVSNMRALNDIKDKLITRICEAPPPPPPPACRSVADIYFLCDRSGSIPSVGWTRVKNFMITVARSFVFGPKGVLFAMGMFSTEFESVFDFNSFTTLTGVLQAINATEKDQGLTFTAEAFLAAWNGGHLTNSHRPGVPLTIVMFTDGQSDNMTRTIQIADYVKKVTGARCIVVTVGNVNMDEAVGIAGDSKFVHSVKSFGAIDKISQALVQQMCQAPTTTTPVPTTTTPEPTTTTPKPTTTTPEPTTTTPEPTTTTPEPTTTPPEPTTTTPVPTTTTPEPTTTTPEPTTTTPEPTTTTPEPTTTTPEPTTTTPEPTTTTPEPTTTTPEPTTTTPEPTTTTPEPTTTTTEPTTTTPEPTTTTPEPTTTTPEPTTTTPVPTTTTPKPTPLPACQNALADVHFLLDASGSIALAGWYKLLNFLVALIQLVIVGPHGVQFSFGKFSNNYTHECDLDTYDNRDDLIKAVRNISKENGGTRTGYALEQAFAIGQFSKGHRTNVPCFIIIETDGQPDDPALVHQKCKEIPEKTGCVMIVILIGVANETEAILMTGDKNRVFSIGGFNEINNVKDKIIKTICPANKTA